MRHRGRLISDADYAEMRHNAELIANAKTTTVERDGRTYLVRKLPAVRDGPPPRARARVLPRGGRAVRLA